jgi:hypothetical protein
VSSSVIIFTASTRNKPSLIESYPHFQIVGEGEGEGEADFEALGLSIR